MNIFKYLHRWTGIALILAGIYIALIGRIDPIGAIVALIGLTGLHIEQGEKGGTLSLMGWIIAILGTLIYATVAILVLFPAASSQPLARIIQSAAFFAGITLTLGYILLGVAEKMAAVYNGNNGVVLAFGALLSLLIGSWGALLLGFGMIWLGYSLYQDKRITQPVVSQPKVSKKGTKN
ncbi:MAG: hypothetical protein P4L50_08005 [Anaerolineaceae bacterium]|nr:hypothetical protein [Anaerolineaceae bacterium]